MHSLGTTSRSAHRLGGAGPSRIASNALASPCILTNAPGSAQEVQATLRAADGDGWTLVAGNARSGAALSYTGARGLPAGTPQPTASAGKWPAAAVVLRVVQEGRLSLDDTPQRFLGAAWGAAAQDARRNVTLRQLLSFTSGAPTSTARAQCDAADTAGPAVDAPPPLQRCVLAIAGAAPTLFGTSLPGSTFNYEGFNLEVAGAMAEAATNTSWQQLFTETIQRRLCAAARYLSVPPAVTLPLKNGLLLISPRDYAAFLRAILLPDSAGGLLSAAMQAQMFSRNNAERAAQNSTLEPYIGADLGVHDWRYGLGVWLEGDDIASSIGFTGTYPRANLSSGAYAVLAPGDELVRDAQQLLVPGMLMRRALITMRAIWSPLERALAESAAAPAPAQAAAPALAEADQELAEDCTAADDAVEETDAASDDAAVFAAQAQRGALTRAAAACGAAQPLLNATSIRVTVHSCYASFVLSKPSVTRCGGAAGGPARTVVHAHAFVDSLLSDVLPASVALFQLAVPGSAWPRAVAASPRVWLKLKRPESVLAAAGPLPDAGACAASVPLSAAAVNAATAARLPPTLAARLAFAPDAALQVGPAWLAAAVEVTPAAGTNDTTWSVRCPSLIAPLGGVPPALAAAALLKTLPPAAMRRLAAQQA